jgi:hypothetical protein
MAAVAVAVLGGVFLGRATVAVPPQPTGLASTQVLRMLAGRVDAVNRGDAALIATYYTDDAVLEELDQQPPVVTTTSRSIAAHLVDYASIGFRLYQTGGATSTLGPFVTEPLTWSGDAGGLVTYQLAADGRIAHQWVTGAAMPSTGRALATAWSTAWR